jgi:hypothetical protein
VLDGAACAALLDDVQVVRSSLLPSADGSQKAVRKIYVIAV